MSTTPPAVPPVEPPPRPPVRTPSTTPFIEPASWAPPTAAPPAKPRELSKLAIGLFVGGSLALVALCGGIVIAAVTFLSSMAGGYDDEAGFAPSGQDPVLLGDPSSPLAVEPTECDNNCFDYYSLNSAAPSTKQFESFGLEEDYVDFEPHNTVASEHAYNWRSWEIANFDSPADCFVTWPKSPITLDLGTPTEQTGRTIWFDAPHGDYDYTTTFTQTVRLFADSESAVAHMVQLDEEIKGCSSFETWFGDYSYETIVTPAAALPVPDNVAVVGWVEQADSEYTRQYVFDLQRGNYVVRTVLDSYEGMSETEFRELMGIAAGYVSEMDFG